MTSQYRHRRTSNPATVFTNPLEPGEIAVNTANRQIAVGDAAAGSTGAPLNLLAVQIFDTRAQYAAGSFVTHTGVLYRAKVAVIPAAFDPTQWEMLVGAIDPQYVAVAGDQMTGPLELPAANPTLPVQAAHKGYVDTMLAAKSSVIVSDAPPTPTPIDSTLWYDTIGGQLYIRYNDGNTVQWVITSPQPNIDQFVQRSGDTMTGGLRVNNTALTWPFGVKTGAGKNFGMTDGGTDRTNMGVLDDAFSVWLPLEVKSPLYAPTPAQTVKSTQVATTEFVKTWAAPFDAMAYSGMQVNGSMEVSQELVPGTPAVNGSYVLDGWKAGRAGTSVGATFYGPTDVTGYGNALVSYQTTPEPSLAAVSFLAIWQPIEGYRVSRLMWGTASAQPITIGFWSQHDYVGTWTGVVKNGAQDRSYAFSYVQNVAGVPEYKVVTIPGDVTGTWLKTNDAGIYVFFAIGVGATYTAPVLNSWIAGSYMAGPGQVNGLAAVNKYFRLTGVVVLPGIEAPSAERAPLIARPYDQELVTCMRYWQRYLTMIAGGVVPQAGAIYPDFIYPVPMRAQPTVAVANITYANATGLGVAQPQINHCRFQLSPTGLGTAYAIWDFTCDARL